MALIGGNFHFYTLLVNGSNFLFTNPTHCSWFYFLELWRRNLLLPQCILHFWQLTYPSKNWPLPSIIPEAISRLLTPLVAPFLWHSPPPLVYFITSYQWTAQPKFTFLWKPPRAYSERSSSVHWLAMWVLESDKPRLDFWLWHAWTTTPWHVVWPFHATMCLCVQSQCNTHLSMLFCM